MLRFALTVSLLAVVYSSSAMAGIVVSATQTRLSNHQSVPVTVTIESDRLKFTLPGLTVIYRADLNRLWAADLRRGIYYELTPESMRQFGDMSAQLSAAQAQLHDTLSQLPPEQRAQIESLLGGMAAPPPSRTTAAKAVFTRAGGSKTIAGYNCDLYRKTVNGQEEEEFCIAPSAAAGIDAAELRVLDRFSEFAAPLMSSQIVPHLEDMDWGAMAKAIGFAGLPMDVVAYDRGRPDIQQTITKVERAAIPASAFELPAGLTKQDLPGLH